ncbi:MAG: hypothetical protein QGH60_03675 [Phycisphaerae bacterium]|jgi:hypothetical protein|nr:hypothetical protein [Phycisphaerae bacterium]
MTQWNDEQFDRVARWLDGEPIQLTDIERELGEDFLRSDKALGDASIPLPSRADRRAHRRIVAALRGVRVRKRVRVAFMSGVSAAAMIVISLGLINLMTTGSILSADYDPLAWLFDDGQQSQEVWSMPEQDPQLVLLAGDLDEIETALFTPEPIPVPIEVPHDEELDQELEELWQLWIEDHTGDSETFNYAAPGSVREV